MFLFRIIMDSCLFITFIAIFATLRSANKPKKNMFMAVTLPYDVLDSDFIKEMQKEYKSMCNKVYLLMLITAIPCAFPFWIFNNIMVYIFYFMIWCLGFAYYGITPFKLMNRKVKAEKAKNGWFVGEKKVVYCDTKTTLLKNSMPISNKYFLIPILIGVIPLIISIKNFSPENIAFLVVAILNLGLILLLFYIAKIFNKNKLKTYSTDSEINFILNKAEKRMVSIYFLINAIIESLIVIVFYLALFEYIDIKFLNIIVVSTLVLSSIVALGFIYIKKKISDLDEELTSKNKNSEIIVDDDDYWIDGIYYYNPNDSSKMVSSRFGYNMTYNMATKHGYFMVKKLDKIVLIGTFILMIILMVPAEISNSSITFSDNTPNISISSFPYSYELDYDDIESVTLTSEPISFTLRTNGIGTETKCIGNFKSDKYGKCRVYLYFENEDDNPPYIVAKLKNSKYNYLLYNTKDDKQTQEIYSKLSNKID
ncbi:hypothetical protein [Intestinibacter bartlettii]|uniref:Bacterial Pleckstrin homology domain-containing protein n=1 Tax=Intestinibacter bartlettii TaxID=261299 RepID=A0ABS6DY37_9FIRM|nr:hypothetical protein [Intestinibacter bartlettii]MBU5336763.1 hypothetical protein [Intestinibacter bartlettii]